MKIKGRVSDTRSNFTLTFRKEGDECIVRFDGTNNPAFWLELTIKSSELKYHSGLRSCFIELGCGRDEADRTVDLTVETVDSSKPLDPEGWRDNVASVCKPNSNFSKQQEKAAETFGEFVKRKVETLPTNPCQEIMLHDEMMVPPTINDRPTGHLIKVKSLILNSYLRPEETEEECLKRICTVIMGKTDDGEEHF